MKSLNDRRGFTLLEVVLGLAISVVIFTLVLGAIRLAERSQRKGMQRQEQTQRVRILYDRLGWLVRGAYPYIYIDPEDPENIELYFHGSSDSLGFVTTSTDSFSEDLVDVPGLKYIKIEVDEGLSVTEQIFFMGEEGDAENNRYVLDTHVKELEFSYLDPGIETDTEQEEVEEGEAFWTGDWDGADKHYLPLAVKIRVLIEQDEKQLWLPTIIARLRAAGKPGPLPGGAASEAPPAVPLPTPAIPPSPR